MAQDDGGGEAAASLAVARVHADVEAQRAAARRVIRARRASIDPPDEEVILPCGGGSAS